MKNRIIPVKLLCAALCCVIFLGVFALCLSLTVSGKQAQTAAYIAARRSSTVIVSLGDSYASGEGNEDFYGYDPDSVSNTVKSEDWLAHRSEKAWAGLLTLPGIEGEMRDHRYVPGKQNADGVNWYFVAASGAVTDNINTSENGGKQTKEYFQWDGKLFNGHVSYHGTAELPGQLDVFYNTPGLDRNKVDYVTVTVGGNDVDFVEIVKAAVLNESSDLYEKIDAELDTFYRPGGTHDKIYNAYKRIEQAAPNAVIIVAGYPQLFDESGGMLGLISEEDAIYINNAASEFNRRICKIVQECRKEGMKIEFADVEGAFDGHLAYSDDPYINDIIIVSRKQDINRNLLSRYSLHPNETGQRKYAEAVQKIINEYEEIKSHPREISDKINAVLVMNGSGAAPVSEMKKASGELIGGLVREGASVGVVSACGYAKTKADLCKNAEYLISAANAAFTDETADIYVGLKLAEKMLDGVTGSKKMIILISDGFDPENERELTGYADKLKEKGIIVCTFGFYCDADVRKTLSGIASRGCDFGVESGDDPSDVVNDIADFANGKNFVYIRIECFADVKVTFKDETLDSRTDRTRTSFGTLTFEKGKDGTERSVKILRLREERDYRIEISGGEGIMKIEVCFEDKDGKYSAVREIDGISTGSDTYAEMNASRYAQTVLKADKDGDGVFETIRRTGEAEPWPWTVSPSAALVITIAAAVISGK